MPLHTLTEAVCGLQFVKIVIFILQPPVPGSNPRPEEAGEGGHRHIRPAAAEVMAAAEADSDFRRFQMEEELQSYKNILN